MQNPFAYYIEFLFASVHQPLTFITGVGRIKVTSTAGRQERGAQNWEPADQTQERSSALLFPAPRSLRGPASFRRFSVRAHFVNLWPCASQKSFILSKARAGCWACLRFSSAPPVATYAAFGATPLTPRGSRRGKTGVLRKSCIKSRIIQVA